MIDLKPHLKNIEHVIWDWNGTLFNDIDAVLLALSQTMKDFGLNPISKEKYLEQFKFPISEFYKTIGFSFKEGEFEKASKDFHNYYHDHIHQSSVFHGAEETLALVKSMGLKQSILTAAFQQHINSWVKEYNLTHFFDNVYGLANTFAHSKVDRGRELIEKAAINPNKTLMIGDTDHDLEVAKTLGFNVILLGDGHQKIDRLKAKHHTVLTRESKIF